jgi:fibronectin type 3 domain-containing protein
VKQVTPYSGSSVKVAWNKASGSVGYQVYYATSKTGTYSYVGSTTSNAYTKTGLKQNKTYYFKVRAYKKVNGTTYYGAYSDVISAATKTPISISKASVTLSTGTYVYSGKAICPSVTVKLSGKTLTKGMDYTVTYQNNTSIGTATITVKGINLYKGSISRSFAIIPGRITTFKQVTPYAFTGVKVAWNKVSGAQGYQVYYSTSASGSYRYVGKTSNNYYVQSRLQAGNKYYFKVRAYKVVGSKVYYGPLSSAALAVTNTVAPNVSLVASSTVVKATWNNVQGAYGYEIYMAVGKNAGYKKIATVKASTPYVVKKNLARNTTYYVRVRTLSKNAQGQFIYSPFSTPKAVKTK